MLSRTHSKVRPNRPITRWLPLAAVFVAGVTLALIEHLSISAQGELGARQAVQAEAHNHAELLRISAQRSLEVLHATAAFFAVNPQPTRNAFEVFVRGSLERLPQLQALEWIPRVPHAERELWERRARQDGLSGYTFTEIDARGSVRPAAERPEYFPVYYAEPRVSNLPALGLDLASDSVRHAALLQAVQSNAPVASQIIRLAQERRAGRFGFLVFVPLHAPPLNKELVGFALAVFRIDDFFAPAFHSIDEDYLRVDAWDEQEPGRSLLAMGAGSDATLVESLSHREVVDFAGRRWELSFTPTTRLVDRHRDAGAHGYPLLLLLLTGVLCAYVYREQERTLDIERKVIARTKELTQEVENRQRTEVELLEAQDTLRQGQRELSQRVEERTSELATANARLQAEVSIRKRAQEEAKLAHKAQSNFIASMSHEIRTPLNAIVGYSQLLHRQLTQDRHSEAVTVMLQSSNHLLALVDDILDLSKIESGHVRLHLVDFNLGSLLSSVMFMFRGKCSQRGLGLELLGVGVQPRWVRGDEGKLRQVLINLLSNAVKFTERGRVCVHVHTTAEHEFEFRVVDTGRGIEQAEHARVFERYFQSDHSSEPGTGLGLAISHRLVEVMGGELTFASHPGRGSTFEFCLHLGPPVAVIGSESMTHFPRVHLSAGTVCRAMVVDDMKVNRDILCEMLEAVGCETQSSGSGDQAISVAPDFRPHIVFMDVLMPEMDGFETTRALLERLGRDHVKIVAFSASAFAEQRARYLEAGFDDFLPKPFRTERVNEMLSSLLGLSFVALGAHGEAVSGDEPVSIPPLMHQQLSEAARLYQATRLRRLLSQLESMGVAQAVLAGRLRNRAVAYDMRGLIAELNRSCELTQCLSS